MQNTHFSDASNQFCERMGLLPSYWSGEYALCDSYHDLFFTIGNTNTHTIVLAVTVETENHLEPERDYFAGCIRFLGHPIGLDDEFTTDFHVDQGGFYQRSTPGFIRATLVMLNASLLSPWDDLGSSFTMDNVMDLVPKLISHYQNQLDALASEVGARIEWRKQYM